jgi:16S rRNA C967 or C1407 C5-methylase (RsmB/RsmF family)
MGDTVSEWQLYYEGVWWMQDPSSAILPAMALENGLRNIEKKTWQKNRVVGLCSAPGGTTAQELCSMGFGHVHAVEISKPRTKLPLNQNLERMEMRDKCRVDVLEDDRMWMPGDGEIVDAVLLSETVYFGFP